MAAALAGKGDRDGAFAALERAVEAGLPPAVLESHPALARLRGDTRYSGLIAAATRLAFPCQGDPAYRALDFWVGDWTVSSGGSRLGTSRVERALRGCALLETWTDVYGNRGTGLCTLDPVAGRWRHHWVDDGGSVATYEGVLSDGRLELVGSSHQPARGGRPAVAIPARLRLEPLAGGGLRHIVERSSDGGGTWTVVFDALYTRLP